MSPDHIRRLLGGYATGTLSGKQRKLLFEAALEDQELFDELARDQALKELLDAPGVRERLLSSIEPPTEPSPWWTHPLPWALGGSALAISAGLMALVFLTPSGSKPVPTEVAQIRPAMVTESPGSAPAPPGPDTKLPNEPKPAGSIAPAGTAAPAPAQPGQPPPAALETTKRTQEVVEKTASARDAAPPPAAPAAAPPPQTPAPAGAAAPRAAVVARLAAPPSRFAFDYSIHDGVMRIVPASDGYLLVRAIVGPLDRLILNTSHLVRSTPAELRVPDGATAMVILFSVRPVQEDSTDDLADRAPTRTAASGTVEDPRPSANSRLELRIAVGGK